ncbi:class I SAM-dependent methyltransferase [Calditrichota bacterium]
MNSNDWDKQASRFFKRGWFRFARWIEDAELDVARSSISSWMGGTDRVVFDIGCGGGRIWESLHQPSGLISCDISKEALKSNASLLKVLTTASKLPFKTASCDVIICLGVTEYIADFDGFTEEMNRVLRVDGIVYLTSSAPTPVNRLRAISGPKLYLRTEGVVLNALSGSGFQILPGFPKIAGLQTHFAVTRR